MKYIIQFLSTWYKKLTQLLDILPDKQRKFLNIWYVFHCIALASSYLGFKGLSSGPDPDKFWPFVVFKKCGQYGGGTRWNGGLNPTRYRCESFGAFPDYDITEFLFYVILVTLVLVYWNRKT